MSEFVQLVGSDDPLASGSALVWSEDTRICFNCPEGMQRYSAEVRIRLPRVTSFFFTRVDPGSFMGFPGVLFTVNDVGVKKIRVAGDGPVLQRAWNCLKTSFFYHRDMVLDIVDCNASDSFLECSTTRRSKSPIVAGNLDVYPVSVKGEHVWSYVVAPTAQARFDVTKAKALGVRPGPKYNLLRRGQAVQSDESPDVTVNPVDVLLPPGATGGVAIVDCASGASFPDLVSVQTSFADRALTLHTIVHVAPFSIVSSDAYREAVRSLSPSGVRHVVASSDYRCRLTAFPTPLANRAHVQLLSPAFVLLPDSDLEADDAASSSVTLCDDDAQGCVLPSSTSGGEPLHDRLRAVDEIVWRFSRRYALRTGSVSLDDPVTFPTAAVAKAMLSDEFVTKFLSSHGSAPAPQPVEPSGSRNTSSPDVGVEFFGTGSAVPSKYRNVSCATILLPPKNPVQQALRDASAAARCTRQRFVLDCGEGSIGQMWNATVGSRRQRRHRIASSHPDALVRFVSSISLVFVSHMHADHHLGIFAILAFLQSIAVQHPSLVQGRRCIVAPMAFIRFFHEMLGNVFTALSPFVARHVTLVDADALIDRTVGPNTTTSEAGGGPSLACGANQFSSSGDHEAMLRQFTSEYDAEVTIFQVDHPACALGLKFRLGVSASARKDQFALVYSGDTQPCPAIERHCADIDLLIHEATFADGMTVEARQKRHSTVAEAIAAGSDANAVLLTHFSQRYPKLPELSVATRPATTTASAAAVVDGCPARPVVGVAFDLLCVPSVRACMAELNGCTPAFQALLAEYDSWGDGTSKRLRETTLGKSTSSMATPVGSGAAF
jgi:ribonuclease Z